MKPRAEPWPRWNISIEGTPEARPKPGKTVGKVVVELESTSEGTASIYYPDKIRFLPGSGGSSLALDGLTGGWPKRRFRKRQRRFLGCRFALTWPSSADRTRALNDRR
jgi:hypothetical protein